MVVRRKSDDSLGIVSLSASMNSIPGTVNLQNINRRGRKVSPAALHMRLDTLELIKAVENETGWSFHQAAREGRTSIVSQYLKSKPYSLHKRQRQTRSDGVRMVNALDNDGLSALHYAARYNHREIMELLLEHGADVNVLGDEDQIPLHHAARYAPKGTALDTDVVAYVPLPPTQEELDEAEEEAELEEEDVKEAEEQQKEEEELKTIQEEEVPADVEKEDVDEPVGDKTVPGEDQEVMERTMSKKSKEKREKTTEEMIAEENGSEPIQLLLSKYANCNAQDNYGMTALHCAADRANYAAVVELTNCATCEVDTKDNLGETALHVAVKSKDFSCVKRLIKCGANPNSMSETWMTPFHVACNEGDKEIMKYLWRKLIVHPDAHPNFINESDERGMTALHFAVQEGDVELVNFLLKKGADVSIARGDKDTPLHLAASHGFLDIVKVLIEHKAEIDVGNADRETALHVAAKFGRPSTVQHLIDKGADIDMRDVDISTPLIVAAAWGHIDVVEILLDAGSPVGAKDKNDKSAVYAAIEENKPKVLELLLEKGGDSLIHTELDRFMNTPVHLAAEKGFVRCTTILLDFGFAANAQNDDEACPLHLAAQYGRIKTAKELVKRDSTLVDDEDETSNTPLHLAAASGHVQICIFLCDNGADVDARNQSGWTAMDCAAACGMTKTLAALLDADAEVDPLDRSKTTPLHLAAKNGHVDTVEFLLDNKADLTLLDNTGRNALELSISANKKEVALIILRHRKWYNAMSNRLPNGDTPMKKLIRKMPDVALAVFNKCTNDDKNEENVTCDRPEYQVEFDYRYLDEFEKSKEQDADTKSVISESTVPSIVDPSKEKVEVIYHHPLQVMITAKRKELLDHPLVRSLVYNKWSSYGRQFYYTNLFVFIIYLTFLTIYSVTQIPPYVTKLISNGQYTKFNSCFDLNITTCKEGQGYSTGKSFLCELSGFIVIAFAVIRIGIEFLQLFFQRMNYMSIHNVTEIILFALSMFFTWNVFYPRDVISHQSWQVGVIVILAAWMNLLMFLRKFPKIGIYIVMFNTVLFTFMEIGLVLIIFIAAFALSFHMILSQYPAYKTNWYSFARTFVMMTGEFEFDSYYVPDTLTSDSPLYYKQISFIMFFVFVIVVPIVFMNLLVGLAVDDIQDVYKQAGLAMGVMKIQLIFQIELLLPESYKRKCNVKTKTFFPNKKVPFFKTFFPKFGYKPLPFTGEVVKAALDLTDISNESKQGQQTLNRIDKRLKEVMKANNELLALIRQSDLVSISEGDMSVDHDNDAEL